MVLENLFDSPSKPDPWGGYDFDKSSLAVIAVNDKDVGAVLWAVGGPLRFEIDEAGLTHLDDLGIFPPSAGVWVWEGKYVWHDGPYEYPKDGETTPEGTFRQPTDEEWSAIRAGRCPWDDEDWKLPVALLSDAVPRTADMRDLTDAEIVECWEAGKEVSLVFSMLAQADAIPFARSILEGRETVPNHRWMEVLHAKAQEILRRTPR